MVSHLRPRFRERLPRFREASLNSWWKGRAPSIEMIIGLPLRFRSRALPTTHSARLDAARASAMGIGSPVMRAVACAAAAEIPTEHRHAGRLRFVVRGLYSGRMVL